ncbi:unnamed protein product [Bathycoccus prasinos]
MRVLLFFLSRGSFLCCAFVLFLLLLDVEIPVVLAEKKPVVPAETIAKWHRHHKLFKEKRLLVRREGEAQSVSAEEKEEKSGWEDRWEHRAKVVEKNNNDDKNNDAIAGKATSPNVAAGKEEESDLALKLFRKIPRKKREEILRALENFKKEQEAEEKEEGAGNRKEERNEEETRRKLELLEKERKEKERKLAVVVAREASVAEAAPSTGEKGDDDGFVPVDESAR